MEYTNKTLFFAVEGVSLYRPPIGRGAFGRVYLAVHSETNTQFACKMLAIENITEEHAKKMVLREIINSGKLDHLHLNKLRFVKRTKADLLLFFDLCNGGDLMHFSKRFQNLYRKPIPNEIVSHFGKQIASALLYLAENKIAHRDLKLANIILTESQNRKEVVPSNVQEWSSYDEMLSSLPICKEEESDFSSIKHKKVDFCIDLSDLSKIKVEVIDFGFSINLGLQPARSFLGTPSTVAPEIVEKKAYSVSCDAWSLGCILFKLKTRANPFVGASVEEMFEQMQKGTLVLPKGTYSCTFIDLIEKLLNFDPQKRIKIQEVIEHSFFSDFEEEIELSVDKLINIKNENMKTCLMLNKKPKIDVDTFDMDIELKEELIWEGEDQFVLVTLNYD